MDPTSISREMSGKQPYTPVKTNQKRQRPPRTRAGQAPTKTKAPDAPLRSSMAAQKWYDAAEAAGMALPYNVNFLAHRFDRKITSDPLLRKMLRAGRVDDVSRWVDKMTERFWAEYVQESDGPGSVANVFLDEAWEDIRDYAFTCLRAAYLKKHGRRVPPPEYAPHTEDGLHPELEKVRLNAWLETAIDPPEESGEVKGLDERRRQVLRSAAEKRRERKTT